MVGRARVTVAPSAFVSASSRAPARSAAVRSDSASMALGCGVGAPAEFQLKQVVDNLKPRLAARHIDLRAMDPGPVETNLAEARQKITIKQGIEQANAKKIVALLKEAKLKVEAQINGDKLRVSGKKKDDLQVAIALLRKADLPIAVQFENFRD